MTFEHNSLEKFIPPYLLPADTKSLLSAIRQFNMSTLDDSKYFINTNKFPYKLQGDCIKKIKYFNNVEEKQLETNCLILSNTCDISDENKEGFREFERPNVVLMPLYSISAYRDQLMKNFPDKQDKINYFFTLLEKQELTNYLYIPPGSHFNSGTFGKFDEIFSISSNRLYEAKKSFTLSQIGHYILLVKISIHFSRFGEGIKRG